VWRAAGASSSNPTVKSDEMGSVQICPAEICSLAASLPSLLWRWSRGGPSVGDNIVYRARACALLYSILFRWSIGSTT